VGCGVGNGPVRCLECNKTLKELIEEAKKEELQWVLDNCSGGGDWRRKIIQKLNII